MSSHGFTVTPHYLGLETAWRAAFTHEGNRDGEETKRTGKRNLTRVIGVNSEMDALPGMGHACGHNLIAIAGVAVACAIKKALQEHNIEGSVVLLGTPGRSRI